MACLTVDIATGIIVEQSQIGVEAVLTELLHHADGLEIGARLRIETRLAQKHLSGLPGIAQLTRQLQVAVEIGASGVVTQLIVGIDDQVVDAHLLSSIAANQRQALLQTVDGLTVGSIILGDAVDGGAELCEERLCVVVFAQGKGTRAEKGQQRYSMFHRLSHFSSDKSTKKE